MRRFGSVENELGVDSTFLEANAAMKSIVRKDTGEDWEAYVRGLAEAEGVETNGDDGRNGHLLVASAEQHLTRRRELGVPAPTPHVLITTSTDRHAGRHRVRRRGCVLPPHHLDHGRDSCD